MKKRLILHAGMSKTGTTSIQNCLKKYSDDLARNGVLYINEPITHNQLAKFVKRDISQDKVSDFISVLEASHCKTVIISSELFEGMSEMACARLKALFFSFEIEIVMYVRRQDQALESMYSELVKKHAENLQFTDYSKRSKRLALLNYQPMLERLSKFFGTDNIKIRPFDSSFWVDGPDVFLDFLRTTGLSVAEKSDSTTHSNPSTTGATTRALQIVNAHTDLSIDHMENYELACRLARVTDKLVTTDHPELWSMDVGFESNEQRHEFLRQFDKCNEWVEHNFLEPGVLTANCSDEVGKTIDENDQDISALLGNVTTEIIKTYERRYGVIEGRAKVIGQLWRRILDEDMKC